MTIRRNAKGHIRAASSDIVVGHTLLTGAGKDTTLHTADGDPLPASRYLVVAVDLIEAFANPGYKAQRRYQFTVRSIEGDEHRTALFGPSKTHRLTSERVKDVEEPEPVSEEGTAVSNAAITLADARLALTNAEKTGTASEVDRAKAVRDTAARAYVWHACRLDDSRTAGFDDTGWTFESTSSYGLVVGSDHWGEHRVRDIMRAVELAVAGRAAVLSEVANRTEGDIDFDDLLGLPTAVLVAMAGDFRDADDALNQAAGLASEPARPEQPTVDEQIRARLAKNAQDAWRCYDVAVQRNDSNVCYLATAVAETAGAYRDHMAGVEPTCGIAVASAKDVALTVSIDETDETLWVVDHVLATDLARTSREQVITQLVDDGVGRADALDRFPTVALVAMLGERIETKQAGDAARARAEDDATCGTAITVGGERVVCTLPPHTEGWHDNGQGTHWAPEETIFPVVTEVDISTLTGSDDKPVPGSALALADEAAELGRMIAACQERLAKIEQALRGEPLTLFPDQEGRLF